MRTARTDAGVGRGGRGCWGWVGGEGVGTPGQAPALPGPQFAQPQKGPGGGFSNDGLGPLGSWVPK